MVNYFKKWLYREVGKDDYRIFKAFLLKVNKNLTIKAMLKDRLITFGRIVMMPIFLRYKKEDNRDVYLLDRVDNYTLRQKHIYAYINIEDIGLIENNIKSTIPIQSFFELFIFFKSYIYALKHVVKILFLPLNFSILQFSNYFYLRTKLNIIRPKKLYIYYSYLAQSYLIALFSTNILRIEVNYMIGNMINEFLKYSYMNNLNIYFSNTLYQEEYKSYKKIGWIKDDTVNYGISGHEFLVNNPRNSFKYDIGFFSSAYWARREGLYADLNIEALREKKYEKNIYAVRENIILRHSIKIARKYNLTFKIYLHPYEKKLITQYNIYPPYWNLIEKDFLEENKLLENNNFFESKVAVLLQSSIFYDRWENNLFTLCYQFKNQKNRLQVPLKYLGQYSVYGFKNLKELEQKTIKGLKVNV